MPSIFISYRRSDSEGEAGRLADDLTRRFGEQAVFMDVDTIQPGRDFRKAIDESIRSCDVCLAIIGPEWFGAADAAGGQRLADSSDYVRLEIASALQRDIIVIPILVRGARMPVADTLPTELQDLAFRNAVELTHARWRSDVEFLTEAIRPLLLTTCEPAPTAPVPPPTPRPKPAPGFATLLDPTVLQDVSRELARFIGPIAPVVVRRAARSCPTIASLVTEVAREIESARDRAAFLAAVSREILR